MKPAAIISVFLAFFSVDLMAGEKEEKFFLQEMIPAAQEFHRRHQLPGNAKIETNQVKHHVFEFFDDGRPGGLGRMQLENGFSFHFFSNGKTNEVRFFKNGKIKTYYDLTGAPPKKVEAVRALNLGNKLNDKTALELAKKYFQRQGHKAEDFQTPNLTHGYWVGKPEHINHRLPYYKVEWYRKDVTQAQLDSGIAALPQVIIEVSGLTSNLVSYSKIGMPIGSDF